MQECKNLTTYKKDEIIVEVAIHKAKLKAYKVVFDKLDSNKGEKYIYRMTTRKQEKAKDIGMSA